MKSTQVFLLFGAILLTIFSGCQTKTKEAQTKENVDAVISEEIGFVSQPKEIKKRDVVTLAIDSAAPNFKLPGIDGRYYNLESFAKSKVLVIIFTCNHCPTAQAYEDRMINIVDDYKNQSVKVVAISPNAVNAVLLEELGYSDMGDSFEEMQIRAKDKAYNFLYLYDGDTQEASIKYAPIATPHAFVFDQERKLKYSGRLDNSEKPGTATADELRSAIDAVLQDIEILEPATKTFGCSIKWGWKNEWTIKVNKDWENLPVDLEEINEAGVKLLMKNDSEKLRLINIWATWCGPCVIEYPEFVDIHRMYKGRDFEFISLSADKIVSKDKALKYLNQKNSALLNYIFAGEDIYKLIEAVDPEWNGALPYTVLIEPEGNIVYKQMGTIDPLELKRIIVDHPMIGRYY